MRRVLHGLTPAALRGGLIAFLVVLALPSAVLVREVVAQMRWEGFHQQQALARDLGERLDGRLIRWVNAEQARPAADYAFLTTRGDPAAGFLQPSPLSELPGSDDLPGLMGHFQVDAQGGFSTPLLPGEIDLIGDYGIDPAARQQRLARRDAIRNVLDENRLLTITARDAPAGPPAQDKRTSVLFDASVDADLAEADRIDAEAAEPARPTDPGEDQAGRSRFAAAMESAAAPQPASAPPETRIDAGPLAERALAKSDDDVGEGFDQLRQRELPASEALGRVEELKLESTYADGNEADTAPPPARAQALSNQQLLRERGGARKEKAAALDAVAEPELEEQVATAPLTLFENEVEPFEFARLDSGHFVLFRSVWTDGARSIQGALIDPVRFAQGVFESAFRTSAVAGRSDLVVAYGGEVLQFYGAGRAGRYSLSRASELEGELLDRMRLSAPLSDFELIFSVQRLPLGPGGRLIGWMIAVIAGVLLLGTYALYRLGLKQIELVGQQQDFVAAVSHELKTPLTSIRMYGEMLREGWAPEAKRPEYYAYIHDEAERLSRLIGNVLQLARLTRNGLDLHLTVMSLSEIHDLLRSKLDSMVSRAGFALTLSLDAAETRVSVDPDALTQVAINLVDNAIKFAAGAEPRTVELGIGTLDGQALLTVRDHGPGVPRAQMKKIFRLFYRPESELTRETVGTGIGLALVHQLVSEMGGRVDVVNRQPGAEFRVTLPVVE